MLKDFFQYYDAFSPQNTHLFIFGDQSYPVGINKNIWNHRGVYDDNFLTTMLYIPPTKSAVKPGVVEKRYDHISLFHTILELFAQNYTSARSIPEITPNAVNKGTHLIRLNQPESDKMIAFVYYPDKWMYNLKTKIIMYFNLQKDRFEQNPTIISTSADIDQFFDYVVTRELHDNDNNKSLLENNPKFPVHIGDSVVKREWGERWHEPGILKEPLAEDFKYYFQLEEKPENLSITLKVAYVKYAHRIFVNGTYAGVTLCRATENVHDCTLHIDGSYLKKGINTLVILNDTPTRGKNDYIIYEVSL